MTLDSKLRGLLEDVSSCLRERVGVRSIVVFGSVARGDQGDRSDVDIIIVSDAFPDSYSARLDLLTPIFQEVKSRESYQQLRKSGYRLSFAPVPYKPDDIKDTPPLLLDVTVDGIILYDDGLMRRKLSEVKQRMQELGSRRVRTRNGNWYWILKPDLKPGEVIEI